MTLILKPSSYIIYVKALFSSIPHKTGSRTGRESPDRNEPVPEQNYRYGYTVPSRPTIYQDGTGTDRNGMGWDKRNDTSSYFKK
ncbi:hypothetical protein H5410_008968 [Solanum commersonii]|uniref:Uncharacterized protein n=1 Tax=Solanum commersonii TaxID=4109 RepID=A0A9J6AGI3_SOLCO|nr:hypothetical protein H5410_008968 [Solanum commersonii]